MENENDRTSHSNYYLPKVEKKDYIVMVDGKNVLVQPINAKLKIMEILEKLLVVREIT